MLIGMWPWYFCRFNREWVKRGQNDILISWSPPIWDLLSVFSLQFPFGFFIPLQPEDLLCQGFVYLGSYVLSCCKVGCPENLRVMALGPFFSASHVTFFVLSHFRDFDSLSKDDVYENNRLVSPCYAVHGRRKRHENDLMEVMECGRTL